MDIVVWNKQFVLYRIVLILQVKKEINMPDKTVSLLHYRLTYAITNIKRSLHIHCSWDLSVITTA